MPQQIGASENSHRAILEATEMAQSPNAGNGITGSASQANPDTRTTPSDQQSIEARGTYVSDSIVASTNRPISESIAVSDRSNRSSALLHAAHKMPPFPPNADFVGRTETTQLLRSALAPRNGNGMKVLAILGPAGIGKTQAAGYFVWTWKHLFDVTFWVMETIFRDSSTRFLRHGHEVRLMAKRCRAVRCERCYLKLETMAGNIGHS